MSVLPLSEADAESLAECLRRGGIALLPTDTVYGVGCDAECEPAARRIYELKGRPAERPAAVMFFELAAALRALPELAEREHAAVRALLPGPVTLLLPNRGRRFAIACGPDPDTLGLRVPRLGRPLGALAAVRCAVLQSSANLSGQADCSRLADVPRELRDGVDLALDAGELPGVSSTVVDLRAYERAGSWRVLREGAAPGEAIERALTGASDA